MIGEQIFLPPPSASLSGRGLYKNDGPLSSFVVRFFENDIGETDDVFSFYTVTLSFFVRSNVPYQVLF